MNTLFIPAVVVVVAHLAATDQLYRRRPTVTFSEVSEDAVRSPLVNVCQWDRRAEFEHIVRKRCHGSSFLRNCPRISAFKAGGPIRRQCTPSPISVENMGTVEIVNTTFDEFLSDARGRFPCVLIAFYSRFCPFSARLAPWYNILPVYYPQLLVAAVEVNEFSGHNARYGITGTPTILLFYHEKPAARFNYTLYSLDLLQAFLDVHTDLTKKEIPLSAIPDSLIAAPLPLKPEEYYDIWLTFSCLFLACTTFYYGVVAGYFKTCAKWLWATLRRRQ